MDSLINDFLQESNENLNRLDHEFVSLEKNPGDRELLGSIFRTIHTIKGTCGFLGFLKLESLAHVGENLLSMLRAGELVLNPSIADALLEMVDAIRAILQEIGNSGGEGGHEYTDLIARLKKCQITATSGQLIPEVKNADPPPIIPPVAGSPTLASVPAPEISERKPPAESKLPKPAILPGKIGGALLRQGRIRPEEIINALQLQQEGDNRRLGEILVSLGLAKENDIAEALTGKPRVGKLEGTIRVDVNLLENQMYLVSELVLLRNRLLQKSAKAQDHELEATVHGLNLVTSELRKNVMKARMQPVSGLYEKLPRLVRDVSKDLGKQIQLETEGGDTELDKTLLEAIKDPVTHILRNSMDHGIELPADRLAAGKPEQGTIRVRAYHEGGNFQLELSDDGAGIDVDRVKEKAISKGLITSAQAQKMSEADLQFLIFAPGLSTAKVVTNVSGRGVGMDVVRTNIERIGGLVTLQSTRGRGTRMRLEIPLTLATIPALTVVAGKNVFAIPQAALVEMLCVEVEKAGEQIENIDGVKVLRFRGSVLPMLSLTEEFQLQSTNNEDLSLYNIVVAQTEGRQFAMQVDSIRHAEEIVIKPLAKQFKKIGLYTGAAILGDGRVALILDLASLARRSGMATKKDDRNRAEELARSQERRSIVLISTIHGERMGIPIEYVERLESLADSSREYVGGLEVMQYRQQILRIVRFENLLGERRANQRHPSEQALEEGKFSAVVVRENSGTPVIFEVGRILGIVKVETSNLTPPSRQAVIGSLVIQERVAELLDMEKVLARVAHGEVAAENLEHAGTSDGR